MKISKKVNPLAEVLGNNTKVTKTEGKIYRVDKIVSGEDTETNERYYALVDETAKTFVYAPKSMNETIEDYIADISANDGIFESFAVTFSKKESRKNKGRTYWDFDFV